MTSIEQKLLDKFRDASLNFSMKDNKIQNVISLLSIRTNIIFGRLTILLKMFI